LRCIGALEFANPVINFSFVGEFSRGERLARATTTDYPRQVSSIGATGGKASAKLPSYDQRPYATNEC
jgi:hypothetical protein